MTREEHIENLKKLKSFHNGSYGDSIRVAIKALEQEPCDKCVYSTKDGYCQYDDIAETIPPFEPCEDCISRQAALDRIRESIETYHNQYTTDMLNMWGLFTQFIKEMPPVNPEPKTGHWLRMSDLSEQEDDRYKCSRCGNVVHYTDKMDLYTFNSWCGRCGSDNGRHINYEVEV